MFFSFHDCGLWTTRGMPCPLVGLGLPLDENGSSDDRHDERDGVDPALRTQEALSPVGLLRALEFMAESAPMAIIRRLLGAKKVGEEGWVSAAVLAAGLMLELSYENQRSGPLLTPGEVGAQSEKSLTEVLAPQGRPLTSPSGEGLAEQKQARSLKASKIAGALAIAATAGVAYLVLTNPSKPGGPSGRPASTPAGGGKFQNWSVKMRTANLGARKLNVTQRFILDPRIE